MKHLSIKVSIFINYFVLAILLNSVGSVILQVQNNYGVSQSSASVLEAFKDLPIAVTSFLVASFVVRIGYRRCMLLALSLIGVACLLMPVYPAFWATKILFAITGISFALIKVSSYATLGIVTKNKEQHVGLMNFLESFFMVGVLSGYFLFSSFVDDSSPQSTSWLRVYYVLAALTATAFLLLLFARLDESKVQYEKAVTLAQDFSNMMTLCIKPLVLVFVISAFLYVLIEQSIMSWLPTFNSQILNLSTSLSIQMASILAASTALGRLVAGFVLQKMDWYRVLVSGLLVAAVLVLVALPLAGSISGELVQNWSSAPLAAFLFPLIGFCIAPVYPVITSTVLSALPVQQHAPMSGLIVVFSALGGTTGSIITGSLFQVYGGTTAFYFSLVPIALMIICLLVFRRMIQRSSLGRNTLDAT